VRQLQIRTKSALIFLIVVLCLGSSSCEASEELKVRLWTDKDQFLPYEPIPVHYEVINNSDSTLTPSFQSAEQGFFITDEKETVYPRGILSTCISNPLAPGETHKATLELQAIYGVLDFGQYTCYIPVETHYGSSNSRLIKSNPVTFRVAAPIGEDEQALNLLLEAQKLAGVDSSLGYPHPGKEELALKKYEEIASKYPNSVYAPIALLAAAEVHARWYEHRRQVIPVCMWLVERYPD